MFLINITIQENKVPAAKADELLAGHRSWFTHHFEKGDFLLVGPYKNKGMAGVVLAQADSQEKVEAIIAEDAYYPNMAVYDISELTANLIADNLTEFKGK
ncbi:YciI family protein [Streptococcus macacae]|uniref:YCII-related domain-containing protein n=1 Tax=Streptococcus macacae NCTC 11558 TaxID=764298 RepID=G5JUR0_9STRE|nr:YciI family protein [Streptococcus macacae]EHJ52392.1 hypothetical protein STRMA_1050 [Streptococcus macacae NCTC 11558]SUN78874.1 putative YCII-related protein [Streptococcus macacae NCTC 11558]